MKWISNGPKQPNENNTIAKYGESIFDAIKHVKQWQSQFIVGRPKPTDSHTVEELEAMGLIGLYKLDE
jgi:hypothetical protein